MYKLHGSVYKRQVTRIIKELIMHALVRRTLFSSLPSLFSPFTSACSVVENSVMKDNNFEVRRF